MTSSAQPTASAAEVFSAARGLGRNVAGWVNVVVAAVIMLATLPGRTQGLRCSSDQIRLTCGLSRAPR